MKKTNIKITGMHCQSCVTILNRALNKEKGIKSAHVNFSTEKAAVEFNPKLTNENNILKAIKNKGYSGQIVLKTDIKKEELAKKQELKTLKFKVFLSAIFAIPTFILGHWFSILHWVLGCPKKSVR